MNPGDLNLHASAQMVSTEMQDALQKASFLVPNWKWLAIIGVFVGLAFLKVALSWGVKKVKFDQHYFKDKSFMQFFLKLEIEKSIGWIVTAVVGNALIEGLLLTPNLERYLLLIFKLILAFNLIRICYLAADAFGKLAQEWALNSETTIDDQLAPLASKTLKVLVIIVGFLILLQNFGVNVTALLAGLGIGGVALAFAAQDTVSNVFGTITIILDAPFKMGDHVRLGETEGFVEEVGFRSTKIRTLYNSTITLPNSVVAKEKIDNLTERLGVIRFRQVLGLTYDSPLIKIQQLIENIKYQLQHDPTVDKSRITVVLNGLAESSLNVLVNFHFTTQPTDNEHVRTEYYLAMLHQLVLQLQLEFAYPTTTMIVQNKPTSPSVNSEAAR